jgi:hypothetical protein
MPDPTETQTPSSPPVEAEAESETATSPPPAPMAPMPPDLQARLAELAAAPIFGPHFFETQLPVLLKQQVRPEHVPRVHFHLAGGDVLEVTRVVGLTLRWLCIHVVDDDDSAEPGSLRSEVVPYTAIMRLSIGSTPPGERASRIGFKMDTRLAVKEP